MKQQGIRKTKKEKGVSPMDAALTYLTARPRTVRETERHLDDQNYGEYEVYAAVERLKELGYLNDAAYAAEFCRSRLASKPISRRKLYEQLLAHQLPKDVIEEALSAVTDEIEQENARTVADKYWRQFVGLEEYERKCRVMRRVLSRGYEFSVVRGAMEELMGDVTGLESLTDPEEDDGAVD